MSIPMMRHDRRHDRRDGRDPHPNVPRPGHTQEARAVAHDRLTPEEGEGAESIRCPPVWALDTLTRPADGPHDAGEGVTLLSASVRSGDPQHGAKRSDDHVASLAAVVPVECPTCGYDRATFEYRAYHHMSGGHAVTCRACDHEHAGEDWG